MKAEDVPFFAALIFPGFFAIQAFVWATNRISMSDTMRITWSFVYSVPTFFGIHAFFRHVVRLQQESLPAPEVIAHRAAQAPIWFVVSLYAGAALAGYLIGIVWRTRYFDAALLRVGLDVRKQRPVLSQALNQLTYVDIKVSNATFRGWPKMFSSEEDDPFIYLIHPARREGDGWQDCKQVLIPLSAIERIYLLSPERPLFPSDNGGSASTKASEAAAKAVEAAGRA